MKVFKFGGASVKDAQAVRNMSEIIAKYAPEKNLLVVVSAMGKTTNALEALWQAAMENNGYAEKLSELKTFHAAIVKELFPEGNENLSDHLEKHFFKLEKELKTDYKNANRSYDQIVSFGEILSTTIIAAYLNSIEVPTAWTDARHYIQTDKNWREGLVDIDWSERLVQADLPETLQECVILTQGFIGGTINKQTTTLGREGSDFSAALFAYCLKAESVTIWKDVPGVLNADPKRIGKTILYPQLSYEDAAEMTYYGASVIHPKTIRPLAMKNIPLYVRSFIKPEDNGTIIGNFPLGLIKPALIFKKNQSLVTLREKDYLNVNRTRLAIIFNELSELNIKINLMNNTAISFTICANTNKDKFKRLADRLSEEFDLEFEHDLELITIKGSGGKIPEELPDPENFLLWQETKENIQLVRKVEKP